MHEDHTYAKSAWIEPASSTIGIHVYMEEKQDQSFEWAMDYVSPNEKGTQINSEVSKPPALKSTATQTARLTSLSFFTYKDDQFKALCGVTKNFVKFLAYRVNEELPNGRILSVENKILLLLTKLKLNVSYAVLASFFDVSESLARETFLESLNAVFKVVSQDIIWFDRGTIQARMPTSF